MHKGDSTPSQGDNHLSSQNTSGLSSLEQHRYRDKWITAAHQYPQETQLSSDQSSLFTSREKAQAETKGIDLQKFQEAAKRVTVFMEHGQDRFPITSKVQRLMSRFQESYPSASPDSARSIAEHNLDDNEMRTYQGEQYILRRLQHPQQREVASQSQGAGPSMSLDQSPQQPQMEEQTHSRVYHFAKQIEKILSTANDISNNTQNPLLKTPLTRVWGNIVENAYLRIANTDTTSSIDTIIKTFHGIQYASAAVSEIKELYNFLASNDTNTPARRHNQTYLGMLKEAAMDNTKNIWKAANFIKDRPLLLHLIVTEWERIKIRVQAEDPSIVKGVVNIADLVQFTGETVSLALLAYEVIKKIKSTNYENTHQNTV